VDDLDVRALHLDVVEQAEVDDVHPQLGVLDLLQRFGDLLFGWHGFSVGDSSPVPD
jgi:hypothetical protein